MRKINVAGEYSPAPAGRYYSDGKFSGQRFRDEFLIPAISSEDAVVIDFDGTEGYGSSFLDEAFGGLVREAGFDEATLRSKLTVVSLEDPTVVDEIWGYVHDSANSAPAANRI
jgi:hypothetical protein